MTRIVPVQLQAGKQYVQRNGRTITVVDNPHWQTRNEWPFVSDTITYGILHFKANGYADDLDMQAQTNIVRPAYVVGEKYVDGDGKIIKVVSRDDHPDHPLDGDGGQSFAVDGRWVEGGRYSNPNNLFDYAPVDEAVGVAAPEKAWIGVRVRDEDNLFASVVHQGDGSPDGDDPSYFLILYDDAKDIFNCRFLGKYREDVCSFPERYYRWVQADWLTTHEWTGSEPIKLRGFSADVLIDYGVSDLPVLPSPYIQAEDESVAEDVELYYDRALTEGMKLDEADVDYVWHVYATTNRDIGDIITARLRLKQVIR